MRLHLTGASLIPVSDLSRQNADLLLELESAVNSVLNSGWFIFGENTLRFEAEFADYCQVRHCVSVANGTDALELSLRAAGCQAGSRVATVANAGFYTSTALLAIGARPVYVDIDERLTLSATDLQRVLDQDPEIQIVVVTHLYGQMADMNNICRLVQSRGIKLIEDCAQAHGAELAGKKAGSFGQMSTFSFYPTKNLGAIGDGGAVLTNSDELADKLRLLRQYGWRERYKVECPGGRNSRLDEIQAAILRIKLQHLDNANRQRREIARAYHQAAGSTNLKYPSSGFGTDYVAHLCVAMHPKRDLLADHLRKNGIATAIHYPIPDYRQPIFQSFEHPLPELVLTEKAQREILTLPCFPGMTMDEIHRVSEAIAAFH